MDVDTATRFITSLTKSLQAVIHGCLDFERDIELGGYVYLRVDNAQRVDYVLSEKMQKSGVNSMTFLSNSFHAIPQASPDQTRPSQHKDSGSASVVETAGKLAASGKTHTMPVEAESPRFSTSHSSSMPSHQRSASGSTKNSDSFLQPQAVGDNDEFQMVPNNLKWLAAATTTGSSKHSRSTAEVSRSNDRTQSLTDFQTAFRSPPTITSQSQQSPSLSHTFSFPQNGSSSRPSSGQPLHHQQHHQQQQQQQQQQQGKSGILPDASEMEVVHIKTEEEDEVFSIRLQCQQGGSEAGTESKADVLQSLTDSQLQASVAGILQSPAGSTQQPGGGAHMGWLDTHLSSLPMQPDTQPPDPFHLQSMMTPQSAASSSSAFLSVPCQPLAQSTPRWFKTPSPASLQNRFSKVSCGLCGHISLTPHAHARHMTIRHSRRGDFACGECGKVFQTKLYLNQHMKSHGERKFACEVCGQKFFYKHHLPRHQLAVHGAITCSTNRRPRVEPQEQPSVAVDNPT